MRLGYFMQNGFTKIHVKHLTWLMPLVLSGIMSGTISCFNLFINNGWMDSFLSIWLHAWFLSWLIAFPLILIILPLIRKLLMKFVYVPEN